MDEWRDYRDDQTLEDKVAWGHAVSIHDLPALFQEGDDYQLINFIDHVVDVETEEVITYGTPLIRRTLGYMDEALYHLSRAVNCSQEIAVIKHGLGILPVAAMYTAEYAYGVGGYGVTPYGGGGFGKEIPVKLQPVDWNIVRVFTTPTYADYTKVSQLTASLYSLSAPNSIVTLNLTLR